MASQISDHPAHLHDLLRTLTLLMNLLWTRFFRTQVVPIFAISHVYRQVFLQHVFYSLQVFQGLLRADKDFHDTKYAMTRLWIHECYRVFFDRLIDDQDRENFLNLITEKLGILFDQTFHNICANKQPPIFGKL